MNQSNWEKAVAFHGHECPGLAIGVKAVEAVTEKMHLSISKDEEIVCITENDACGVDAIQSLLSCTIGKGNLIYRGTGKQAFSFFNRETGDKLRVCLKAKNTQNIDRKTWQKYLLEAPVEEVFEFSVPKYDLPERARIFNTEVCELCGEGAPEHKMRLSGGKRVCLDCVTEYNRGW